MLGEEEEREATRETETQELGKKKAQILQQ
jgi:hypothetical protein